MRGNTSGCSVRISVERSIATIVIDRPRYLNTLTSSVLAQLTHAFRYVERDPKVRVVLLTGAGRAFSAGADLRELATMTPREGRQFALLGRRLVSLIRRSMRPVVAVVDGYALGGGLELATACDLIIASERSEFGIPAARLGLFSVWGGVGRILSRLGPIRAKELLLLGRRIDAKRAQELGLVNIVVPARRLWREVRRITSELSENAPNTMVLYKRLINESTRRSYRTDMPELRAFIRCLRSKDFAEGVAAFLKGRKPRFIGR